MATYEREDTYIRLLSEKDHTVTQLANKLFVSEPTVRRDIAVLKKKGLVLCNRGLVTLKTNSPDHRIPMFIRDLENPQQKQQIARRAARHIKDGFVIMLDASTTAYCLLPYLAQFQNIFVITSGSKTAIALAAMGIRTLCTGGEMALGSFSYIGSDAERTLRSYNADIAFFSCRGLTDSGFATDNSIGENAIRRIMIENAKQSYLLCDSSKLGKKYLHTLCSTKQITAVITDDPSTGPINKLSSNN